MCLRGWVTCTCAVPRAGVEPAVSPPHADSLRTRESVITCRKTPRKPQKAARAAGLRRAPPHHSPQARSGILNRKTLRMPPMAARAAEEGRPTQDLPTKNHAA